MKAEKKIRMYLFEQGTKMTSVAQKIGMDYEVFRRCMNGKRELRADELLRIMDVLALSPQQLK